MARRGFTLVEALVALALLALLFGAWWGLLSLFRRGEAQLTDRAAALASAELAALRLGLDVQSMFPPDPFRPERCPEVTADGAAVSFLVCARAGDGFTARRVRYALRVAGRNLYYLTRDGRPLGGVTLAGFSARIAPGPRGEPRLFVDLTGAAGAARHPLALDLALPAPGPSAIIGLPPAADALLARAITL